MTDLSRTWLARSLAGLAPALRILADDPAVTEQLTPAELVTAADVIERTAYCLQRPAAGGEP
jgi:hypothetical protein